MQKIRLVFVFILFLAASASRAQVVYCPPNIDFENNNFNNWYLYTGSCCPIVTNNFNATPVNNRHTMTSGAGVDFYGGFPVVSPFGGNYSLRLGNSNDGAQAERARYYIRVPNNIANYSLIFRYAVVFENPNHTAAEQPRFEVKAYDSITNALIPCIDFSFVASANLPGFALSTSGTDVWYKPWSTASLDLSGFGGRTIAIDFASGDCDLGQHFGYGYVDMNCGLFQVSGTVCKGSANSQISAPAGFAQYRWYDSTFTTLIDTLQTISVPTPVDSSKYKVVLIPFPGFGCPDTLESMVYVSDLAMKVNPDTTICLGNSVQLRDTVTASNRFLPITYNWTTGPNLSCTNCLDPIASPTATNNKYVLRVTDVTGCSLRDSFNIAVREQHINSQPQNLLQCRGTRAVFKVVAAGSAPFIYQWRKNGVNIPGETKDSLVITNIGYTDTANYTVAVMGDCDTVISSIARLQVYPTPVITVQPQDIMQCPGTRAVLRATATNGALNYLWKKNGTNIPGSTKDSLVFNTVAASDTASYFMMVGGQCDTVYSDTVYVKIKQLTGVIIEAQTDSQCIGGSALFNVRPVQSGNTNFTYQWKKNGVNIPGATNDTLILTNLAPADFTSYRAMVKSECDSMLSPVSILAQNPPTHVVSNPVTITQCKGTKAVMRVTATGTGTLRYQWKKNTININGETRDSLVLGNINYSDTADYTVTVMGDCDTVTTAIAKLHIYPTPVITMQPLDVLQCPGTKAVIRSTATNGVLNYGWVKNGANIPASNKDSLVINAIAASDTASYFMMAGGQCDTVYSDTVELKMKPLTVISMQPQSISQCVGDQALFRVVASGSGTLSYQWKKNNTIIPGATNDTFIIQSVTAADAANYAVMVKSECDSLQSSASIALNVNPPVNISAHPATITQCTGTKAVFRVNATGTGTLRYQWKKNNVNISGETKDSLVLNPIAYADTADYSVVVMTDCDTVTSNIGKLHIYPTPVISIQPQDVLQCPGTKVVLRSTATNGVLNYLWKKNGVNIPGSDKDSLVINALAASDTGTYFMLAGGQCDTVYSDTVNVRMKPLTTIQMQPQNVDQCLGNLALFSVTASGSGILSYQWKKNTVIIPGATNDTFIIEQVTAADAGNYSVMVKSECDSIESSAAVSLSVKTPVSITSQPISVSQCLGTRAVFRVSTTGVSMPEYQWQKNGIPIIGASKDSLVITNIGYGDTADYTVLVMTDCDTLTSDIGKLSIHPVPVITAQPQDILQCPNTKAVFRMAAINGVATYQWKKNGINIPSANTDSLVINAISVNDTGAYVGMVIGQCDTVYSDTVDLKLKLLTSIVVSPQINNQCFGNDALFSVTANGHGTFTYQWKKGGIDISGATNDTLFIPNVSFNDTGDYAVTVRSECDSVRSAAAQLNMNPATLVASHPSTITQCKGTKAVFKVTGSGTGLITYQWRKNNIDITGATTDSLVLNTISYSDTADYTVVVMADCDTVVSNIAQLHIFPTPVITAQPQPVLQCPATKAVFNVSANNGALSYQWKKNGVNIPGAQADSLVINSIAAGDTASYSVMVIGQCDTVYSDTVKLQMKLLTSIVVSPQINNQCFGNNALFSVTANGHGTFTYQWKKGGVNIHGETNDTLFIPNVSFNDTGDYAVTVRSECDSVLSAVAQLNMNPATIVASHPSTITQCKGTRAVFKVSGTGTGTVTYQWKKNNTDIPGATNDSLVLNNITYSDTADYTVVVMAGCDTVVSNIAKLHLYPTPIITAQPQNLLQCPGTRAVLRGAATNGALNYIWKKNGSSIPGATTDSLVINAISSADSTTYFMMVGGQCDTVYSDTATLSIKPLTSITIQPQSVSQCLGDAALFSVAASGSGTLSYQWKKNSIHIPGATNDTLIISNISDADSAVYTVMVTSECDSLESSSSVRLHVNPAAHISSHPSTITQCKGTRAVFRVNATGTGTLRYQWKKNNVDIPFATSDSIVLSTIGHTDTADYSVAVMTDCDTIVSNAGRLHIYPTPVITVQVQDLLQCPGTKAVFRATATNGALTYQWRKNGVDIPGATTDSLIINAISAADTVSYFLMIGGQCDTVYSDTADLKMKLLTSIVVSPQINNQCFGNNALFSVTANGYGTFTYQWKKGGIDIPGATNDTLLIPNVSFTDTGDYAVTVRSECDSVRSANARLNMNPATLVNSHPTTITQCSGTRAVFRVNGTGTGTVTYQWKKNGNTITGATRDSLVLNNISPSDTADYTVVVMAECDTVVSNIAKLHLYPTPVITVQPQDLLQCPGTRAVLRGAATNGALNYLWKKNGITVPGSDKDSLVINALASSDTASYFMLVGGQCDTVYSDTVDVKMKLFTGVTMHAQTDSQCLGGSVMFVVRPIGLRSAFTYQWKKNGVNIPGATNDTLIINNLALADFTNYSAMVKNECDSILSPASILNRYPPTSVLSNPVSIIQCKGTRAVFRVNASGSGPIKYQWKKNGFNIPGATADSLVLNNISFGDTALYSVMSKSRCDSMLSFPARLRLHPVPQVHLPDTDICENAAVLSVPAGFVAYLWNTGSVTNSTGINTPGSYWVRVTDGNTCSNSDTANVTIKKLPEVNAGNDVSWCNEAVLNLNATATGQTSVRWLNNISGSFSDSSSLTSSYTVLPGTTGSRTLTIMASNRCGNDTDELVVNFTPKVSAAFVSDTLVCERSPLVLLQPANAGGQFSGSYVSGSSFDPRKAGIYELKYRIANNGCVDSSTRNIRVVPMPEASFKTSPRDLNIDKDVEFISTSKNALSYLWRFDDSTATGEIARHYYGSEGAYWVELVAINEMCRDSLTKMILIEGSEKIWAPNAFTPNQDGINDVFRVHYKNAKGGMMMIYNRWGQEIFRTYDLSQGWDGTFMNQPCQDDAYVWIVQYTNNENVSVEASGTVTLMH